jgi:hypothetical protein
LPRTARQDEEWIGRAAQVERGHHGDPQANVSRAWLAHVFRDFELAATCRSRGQVLGVF